MFALRKTFTHFKTVTLSLALALAVVPAGSVSALTQPQSVSRDEVKRAQQIMTKFGIPTGPHDGLQGPLTARGLCTFRYLVGAPAINRAPLDRNTYNTLVQWNNTYPDLRSTPKKYLSDGTRTYLVVDKTCQMMTYVHEGTFVGFMPVSTGRAGQQETPNGYYKLGDVTRGWTCSTEYPETCRPQTGGKFANLPGRTSGNMYNKRPFKAGGFYVHGSNSVPTYPGSAGCIRVSVAHADYIYDHVPTNIAMSVQGQYVPDNTASTPAAARSTQNLRSTVK